MVVHLRPRSAPVVTTGGPDGSRSSHRSQSSHSVVTGSSLAAPVLVRQLHGHDQASSHIGHGWWSVGSAHLQVCGRRPESIGSLLGYFFFSVWRYATSASTSSFG